MRRQSRLLGLPRSSLYYNPCPESAENLELMQFIDKEYLEHPFYGSRQFTSVLQRHGYTVNRKRVQRLMHLMGLEAIYPKPRTTVLAPGHKVYPYLLRGYSVGRSNEVWSADITYVPMANGFLYLVSIMDWYSRYVISWRLSNSLETHFCLDCLEEALSLGTPEIFNTDQGVQFTSAAFTSFLEEAGVRISMDGCGRAFDNIFIERLWRTVKYEEIYRRAYPDGREGYASLQRYFRFYNEERPHQSLGGQTPREVYEVMWS